MKHRWSLALLVACGGKVGTMGPEPEPFDASPPTPELAVHGKFIDRFFPDSGEVDVPRDLSKATIDARVGDAIFPGAGHTDGTFTIPGVSAGPFMLHVLQARADSTMTDPIEDEIFIDGAMDGIVLTSIFYGRQDADRTPSSVNADLDISNVAPITLSQTAIDQFVIQSTNAGCGLWGYDWSLYPKPNVGDTSLQTHMGGVIDYGCRIDPSKGDKATFYQTRAPIASDPPPHAFAIRKLDLPNFSKTDKSPAKIAGALVEIPATDTVKVDFRPSTFAAALPNATVALSLFSAPRKYAFGLPLARIPEDGQSASDGVTEILHPNPFPSGWSTVTVSANRTFPLAPVDAVNPVNGDTGYASSSQWVLLADASMGPLGLLLAPPKDPRIADAAPFAPAKGVGLRPTIHWSRPDPAPAGPIVYSVQLVGKTNGPMNGFRATNIWTTATSVTVPSGILQAGNGYTAFLRASWSPSPTDFALHPFDAESRAQSVTSTGEFSP